MVWLITQIQDNTIYKFLIDISLSSKGQNKSKLQKQISNVTSFLKLYQAAVTNECLNQLSAVMID